MPPPTSRSRRAPRVAAVAALLLVTALLVLVVGLFADRGGSRGPAAANDAVAETELRGVSPRTPDAGREAAPERFPRVEWRDSVAVGIPEAGRLVRGVQVPAEGRHFFTWDPIESASPNRGWRRWGTDHLVRTLLGVLADHRQANPGAPRVGVGDLSRPRGGDFGPQFGIVGHVSHQNGLDVDLYYPLTDRRERTPLSADEIDRRLSQDLVDRFVAAGAEKVLVGPSTGLTGPPDVVQAVPDHDNHIHLRIPPET